MMVLSTSQSIVIIAVCAVCTFIERALPFVIFRKGEVPEVVKYLGKVLPMAIMATLVIYCVKGISFAAVANWVPTVIACAVTVALHLWKHNAFISILGSTAVYMVLVQLVFS